MASQVNWASKTQEWSGKLTSLYNSFPKMPDGLSGEDAERQQEQIDKFIQEFFTRETKEKEKCDTIFKELISFVNHLIEVTDHPVLRYKELQQTEPTKQAMVSFLEMVVKVQCLSRAELTAWRTDPIYKGCVQIAHVYDFIPLPQAAALAADADPTNWMEPSLAHHVVTAIRTALQSSGDDKAIRRCQAIFQSVKAYMDQLKFYYELPVLGQWAFYNACLGIFPYVTDDQEWADKIQRLALARLSKEELNKVKTPSTTPTKAPLPESRLSTPTREKLVEASVRLQAAIASEQRNLESNRTGSASGSNPHAAGATTALLTGPEQQPAPTPPPVSDPAKQAGASTSASSSGSQRRSAPPPASVSDPAKKSGASTSTSVRQTVPNGTAAHSGSASKATERTGLINDSQESDSCCNVM